MFGKGLKACKTPDKKAHIPYLGTSTDTLSDQALLETVKIVVNWRIKIDLNKSEIGRSAIGRVLMPGRCDRPYLTHGLHAG